MTFPQILAIFYLVISSGIVYAVIRKRSALIINLALLAITPYFLILLLQIGATFGTYDITCNGNRNNLYCLFSIEYLYFFASRTLQYKIAQYGLLLPSLIPVTFIGIYTSIFAKTIRHQLLLIGSLISAAITYILIPTSSFFIMPIAISISIFSTIGAHTLISKFKQLNTPLKTLSILYFLLIFYEGIRLLEIIIIRRLVP